MIVLISWLVQDDVAVQRPSQVIVSCCNTRGQCPSISQHQANPSHTFTANSCSHQFATKIYPYTKCLQSTCNSSQVRFFSRRGVRVLLHDIRCYQILTLVPQGCSRWKEGRPMEQPIQLLSVCYICFQDSGLISWRLQRKPHKSPWQLSGASTFPIVLDYLYEASISTCLLDSNIP